MASPYQYPWVNFNLYPTSSIDSTPAIAFPASYNSIVDSIFICNTTKHDALVSLYILSERVPPTAVETYFVNRYLVPKWENVELMKGSVMNLQAGDLLYAFSDNTIHEFDCLVSYRQLLESPA